jgi:hypothetical protein
MLAPTVTSSVGFTDTFSHWRRLLRTSNARPYWPKANFTNNSYHASLFFKKTIYKHHKK